MLSDLSNLFLSKIDSFLNRTLRGKNSISEPNRFTKSKHITDGSSQVFTPSKNLRAYHKLKKIAVEEVTHFQLPRIAVIGAQSCGKSSVLEKIIGVDILPKGSELTTRCPILIHLNPANQSEYGVIDDGEKIDIWAVKDHIKERMAVIIPQDSNIVAQKITVDLFIKDSLELTLIDLPGFTKIPVGDQPANIESIIEEMVLEYIKDPNTIILAISPANVDLANSDSLKLAKRVDLKSERTIGVISKIDMMDKRTDCVEILSNKVFPLQLGYIGVINRNVADLRRKIPIQQSIQNEMYFFKNHRAYKEFVPKIGTYFLRKQLQRCFENHLIDKLPCLKKSLQKKLEDVKKSIFTIKKQNPAADILIREYIDALRTLLFQKPYKSEFFFIQRETKAVNLLQHFNTELTTSHDHFFKSGDGGGSLDLNFIFDSVLLKAKLRHRHSTIFNQQQNIEEIIHKNLVNLEQYILKFIDMVSNKFLQRLKAIQTRKVSRFLERANLIVETDLLSCFTNIKERMSEWIEVEKTVIIMADKNVCIMSNLLKIILETTQRQGESVFDVSRLLSYSPKIRCDNFLRCTYYEKDIIHDVIKVSVKEYVANVRLTLFKMTMNALESEVDHSIDDLREKMREERSLYKKRNLKSDDYSQERIAELKRSRRVLKKAIKVLRRIEN